MNEIWSTITTKGFKFTRLKYSRAKRSAITLAKGFFVQYFPIPKKYPQKNSYQKIDPIPTKKGKSTGATLNIRHRSVLNIVPAISFFFPILRHLSPLPKKNNLRTNVSKIRFKFSQNQSKNTNQNTSQLQQKGARLFKSEYF